MEDWAWVDESGGRESLGEIVKRVCGNYGVARGGGGGGNKYYFNVRKNKIYYFLLTFELQCTTIDGYAL